MKKFAPRYDLTDWPLWLQILFLLAVGGWLGWVAVRWLVD